MPKNWLVELDPRGVRESHDGAPPPSTDPLQELTSAVASEATRWDRATAEEVRARFDERALDWSTRDTPEYRFPLEDALERGGVPRGGLCLEIGSGTGIQTPTLLGHFSSVLAVDLSLEMLRRTPEGRGQPLRADASRLPVAPDSASAVVCVNAFLFAAEYVRALRPDGVVVFVSTRGDQTPIYLAPEALLEALRAEAPEFGGVTARAGGGCWTVARRS